MQRTVIWTRYLAFSTIKHNFLYCEYLMQSPWTLEGALRVKWNPFIFASDLLVLHKLHQIPMFSHPPTCTCPYLTLPAHTWLSFLHLLCFSLFNFHISHTTWKGLVYEWMHWSSIEVTLPLTRSNAICSNVYMDEIENTLLFVL